MNIINDGGFCTPPRRSSSPRNQVEQQEHVNVEATTPKAKQVSPLPPPRLLRMLAGSHNNNMNTNTYDRDSNINDGDSIPLIRTTPHQQKRHQVKKQTHHVMQRQSLSTDGNQEVEQRQALLLQSNNITSIEEDNMNISNAQDVNEGDIHILLQRLNAIQQDNNQQKQQQKGEQLTKHKEKIDPDGSKISRRNSIQLNNNDNGEKQSPSSSSGSSSSKTRQKKSKKSKETSQVKSSPSLQYPSTASSSSSLEPSEEMSMAAKSYIYSTPDNRSGISYTNDGNRSIQSDSRSSCRNSQNSNSSSSSTSNNGSSSSSSSSSTAALSARDEYQLQKIRLARLLGSPERRSGTVNKRLTSQTKALPGQKIGQKSKQQLLHNINDTQSSTTIESIHDIEQQHYNDNEEYHEYAMSIHPESIKGTCEAAAWHLHGQTGGRRRHQQRGGGQSSSNRRHQGDSTVAVMDARALMNGLTKDVNVKNSNVDSFDDNQIMAYKQGKDTNVKMDIENNGQCTSFSAITRDTHSTYHQHNDQWSTGLAASIVTGTASRYYKSFFNFPHGRKILLPIVMGILATLLSFITLTSCQFMTIVPKSMVETDMIEQDIGGYVSNQIYQVGPWKYLSVNPTYSDGEVCLSYPSNMIMDVPFMISRIVSASSSVCGCILVLWSCTLMCIPARKSSMIGLGLCFVLVGILELMTVLFYKGTICNEEKNSSTATISYFGGGECSPNQDLIYCIASCILFVATGWILYILSSSSSQHNLLQGTESSMEVYTWSSVSKSSNPKRGIIRTIEKSWMKIPDGSTLMATVFVEQQQLQHQSTAYDGVDDQGGSGSSQKTRLKTTYSIQTEILPA